MQANRQRTPLWPPGLCNNAALRKATRRVSQFYDAALAPCGLRATQHAILVQVARTGTPSMGALATALVLDRSALAHNIKPLERDGLLVVAADPADRRSRIVQLTDSGHAKLIQSRGLWQTAQQRFEQGFGVQNAAALRATLAEIATMVFDDAAP